MKKIFIIAITLTFFLIGDFVLALEDNFDSYSLGVLTGGWSTNGNMYVTDDYKHTLENSIKGQGGTGTAYKSIAGTNHVNIHLQQRTVARLEIGLVDSSNNYLAEIVIGVASSSEKFNLNICQGSCGAENYGIQNLDTGNYWYSLDIEWQASTTECIRFAVDGSMFTQWFPCDNYTADRLYLTAFNGDGRFDTISEEYHESALDDVTIIDLPDFLSDVQVGAEHIMPEYYKRCKTGENCDIKIRYPYSFFGKEIYLFKKNDIEDLPLNAVNLDDAEDFFEFEEQSYLIETLRAEDVTATSSIKYCYIIVDNLEYESLSCNTIIDWRTSDTIDDLIEKLGIDRYDINDACLDVATSSGSTADDFRYGVECGLNKTAYWLIHPKDETWLELENSTSNILNEFPLNLYQVMWVQMKDASEATSTPFELPIYIGDLDGNGGSSTVVAWSTEDLEDNFGDTWLNFYNFIRFLIYATVIMYFIKFIITNKEEV